MSAFANAIANDSSPDKEISKSELAILLSGVWTRHLDKIKYLKDGSYLSYKRGSDNPVSGRWEIHGRSIKHIEGNKSWNEMILSITSKELHLTFGDGSEGLEYKHSEDF